MAKKCNILMKRQNSNLFKYESTIKDIKWYPFIILMGQNQEI